MRTFDAVIEEAPRGGALVEIPFDAKAIFGSGRPKIIATFDGVSYRGSIASMGGRYVLGVAKAIRGEIGKDAGDTIRVTVEADTTPRVVEVPEELAKALTAAGLRDAFDALSYTRRKETVRWVETAKKEETRMRRVQKAVEGLGG